MKSEIVVEAAEKKKRCWIIMWMTQKSIDIITNGMALINEVYFGWSKMFNCLIQWPTKLKAKLIGPIHHVHHAYNAFVLRSLSSQ